MNTKLADFDFSSADPHERARMMIALSGTEGFDSEAPSRAAESWLTLHLESCASCREFAKNSDVTVRALRGVSITADSRLVSLTQMRLRQRAQELQRQRERMWVICVCCTVVTFSAAVTTFTLWMGFAWLGRQARLSAPLWQSCFVVFYLLPAVLAGIFLLAHGTFLADHNGSYQHGLYRS